MRIEIEIRNKESGEIKTITKEGNNKILTLTKFMLALKKYARKEWVIESIKTDDPLILMWFDQNAKNLPIELI